MQRAAAVGHDAPADRMDGEHHPLAELVHDGAVLAPDRQAGALEILQLIAGGAGRVDQRRPARRRPAEAPLPDGRVFQTAAPVVIVPHGAPLAAFQLVGEELLGEIGHQQQALPALPGCDFLGGHLLFLDLDVILLGQITQRLDIAQVLVLHQEAHRGTRLAAAETLVDALGGRYIKGRRLLVVEGTAGHEIGSAAPERHEVPDHIFDAGGIQNEVDCLLRDHRETKLVIMTQSRKGI